VNTLSRIIKEGALPVNLKIIEERTVGPSLGQEPSTRGSRPRSWPFRWSLLFMIAYYKLAGLIAVIGLSLNFVFMLALLSWLGFTLTLPASRAHPHHRHGGGQQRAHL
jgi:preprotein translocase subunit SecD